MKMTKERALIARLANTLESVLAEVETWEGDDSVAVAQFIAEKRLALTEAKHFLSNTAKPTADGRVYLSDPEQIYQCGLVAGVLSAQELIAHAEKTYKLAGLGLASSLIAGKSASERLRMIQQNIGIAVKGGLDLNGGALRLDSDADGFYLTVEPVEG